MNSFIATVRKQFPNDPRSDQELTYFLGEWAAQNRPDLFEQFPDFGSEYKDILRTLRPSLGTEFSRAFGSSVDNLQATALGAGALVADAVGADDTQAWLMKKAREQAAEASSYRPSVGSYADVETPGDALSYLAYGAGTVAPSALETAGFALAGGGIGGLAARGGAKSAIESAVRRGAQAGIAASTIPQAAGEVYNEIEGTPDDVGIAAVAGTFSGLLDLIPEGYVLGKFFRPGSVVDDATKKSALRYVKALGTEAAKTMPMEGTTEAVQEFINIAAAKYARGEPIEINEDDAERMMNAGIIGSIGGTMFAPAAAYGELRNQTTRKIEPNKPQAGSPATPSSPIVVPLAPGDESFIGPEGPAYYSAERMMQAEQEEAAYRRSPEQAGELRRDLARRQFTNNDTFDWGARDALNPDDVAGQVTPVDTFIQQNKPVPATELDYIAKVQQAVAAAAEAARESDLELGRQMLGNVPDEVINFSRARAMATAPDPREFGVFTEEPLSSGGVTPDPREFGVIPSQQPNPAQIFAQTQIPAPMAAPPSIPQPSPAQIFSAPQAAAAAPAPASIEEAGPAPSFEPPKAPNFATATGAQIEDWADESASADRAAEVYVFGRDGAARYRKLDRVANGSMTTPERFETVYREMAAMESALTDAQRRILYGQDLPPGYIDEDTRRSLRNQALSIDSSESVGELAQAVSRLIRDAMYARSRNESVSDTAQQMFMRAMRRLRELGGSPQDLISAAMRYRSQFEGNDVFELAGTTPEQFSEFMAGTTVSRSALAPAASLSVAPVSPEPPLGVSAAPQFQSTAATAQTPAALTVVQQPEPETPAILTLAPEQALSSVVEAEDFRGNEVQAQESRIQRMMDDAQARMKDERGKESEDKRKRAVLIVDRATGKLYQREVVWKDNKRTIAFAQRRAAPGHGKGRGRVVTVDLDSPQGGVNMSTLLNEQLPDGSQRYDVAGFVVLKPKAQRNVNLGSAEAYFASPQYAEAVRLRNFRKIAAEAAGERIRRGLGLGDVKRKGGNRKTISITSSGGIDADILDDAEPLSDSIASEPTDAPSTQSMGEARAKFVRELADAKRSGASDKELVAMAESVTRRLAPSLSQSAVKAAAKHLVDVVLPQVFDADLTIRTRPIQGYGLPTSEVGGAFQRAVQAVQSAGGDIAVFEQDSTSALEAVRQSYGVQMTTAEGRSVIALGVDSLLNPVSNESFVKLLHEAAHQFVKSQSAEVQRAYHQALDQLHWSKQRWILNPNSLDIRLIANTERELLSPQQAAVLDKLSPEEVNRLRSTPPETILSEQGAEHLAMLGVDKASARSLIQQAIRLVKDLLLSLGLSVQRALGMQPSQQMTRLYVENRFLQFINRDFAQGPQAAAGLRSFVGAPQTFGERVAAYRGLGTTNPEMMYLDLQSGALEPGHIVADDVDSMIDSITATLRLAEAAASLTVRGSAGEKTISFSTEIDFAQRAAEINFISSVYRSAFSDPGVARALPAEFSTMAQGERYSAFLKQYVGVTEKNSPEAKMASLRRYVQSQKNPITGQPVSLNEQATVASLPATTEQETDVDGNVRTVLVSSAQDKAMRGILSQLRSTISRLSKRNADDLDFIERTNKSKRASEERRLKAAELQTRVVITSRILEKIGAAAADLEIKTETSAQQDFYPGASYSVPDSSGRIIKKQLPRDMTFTPAKEQEFLGDLKRMSQWLDDRANMANGEVYNNIRETHRRLSQHYTTRYLSHKTTAVMRNVMTRSIVDTLRVVNTPAALNAARQLIQLQSWVTRYDATSRIVGGKWSEAYRKFAESLGRKTDESFREDVWSALSRSMEQVNETERAPKDVVADALKSIYGIDVRSSAATWRAFSELVSETREAQKFEREIHSAMGLKVQDKALGEGVERRLLRIGYGSGRRSASRMVSALYGRMNPVWSTDAVIGLTDLRTLSGMSDADIEAAVGRVFSDSIVRDFVEPLAKNNSPFIGLTDPSGVVSLLNVWDMRLAWEQSNGDVMKFARIINDAHGGGVSLNQTVADIMRSFHSMFGQIKADHEQREAASQSGVPSAPRQMMDARLADNWPAEWVSYSKYDIEGNYMFLYQSAMAAALGRGGFGPNGEFSALISAATDSIREARDRAESLLNDGKSRKEIREEMGEADYEKAENASSYISLLGGFMNRANSLTHTIGYNLGDARWMVEASHFISTLLLQNPRSALINSIETVIAPFWRTKFSKTSFAMASQNIRTVFGDTAEAFGANSLAELARNSDMARRRHKYGVVDPDAYLTARQKWADIGIRLGQRDPLESRTASATRLIRSVLARGRDLTNIGANDARDLAALPIKTKETVSAKFRPFGLFNTVSQAMNGAFVDGVYSSVSDLALRGIELIDRQQNPAQFVASLENGTRRLDNKDLGYVRSWLLFNDKPAFDYLADGIVSKMGENSLEQFIAGAWRRAQAANGGKFEVLTGRQFMGVVTMAMTDMNLQSNFVNTPIGLLNNPMGRALSTFLVWPWNAMIRGGNVFRDTNQQITAASVFDGLTVVMMGIVPATLGASFLVDLYDEELLGKRSNLRELPAEAAVPGMALAYPMASLERLARYGAFGLASEAVNGMINFDDARGGFSADNRIFILNQLQSARSIIGGLVQQEGNMTYQSVGRPLLQFMGMNGPLQYIQLVSNQMPGVNNAEEAVNVRINAGNYMRAAGRALDLDVRVMKGAQAIPTPITPYIQQMEIAALSGDTAPFRSAFARAIQEAIDEKGVPMEDAEKYVKQAFADRHPLRRIFRTMPSQDEYRQMLGSMNDRGRESVSRAVLTYNNYLSMLRMQPVVGEKSARTGQAAARVVSLEQARAAAAAASYNFGP